MCILLTIRSLFLPSSPKTDNPNILDRLPVGLQLVGRRFEDEKVLAILDYITRTIDLPFVEFP